MSRVRATPDEEFLFQSLLHVQGWCSVSLLSPHLSIFKLMEVQLMAVFDITLWQGAPAAEVGQLFRRRFVLDLF